MLCCTSFVWIENHAFLGVISKTDRQRIFKFAAARLVQDAALQPSPQYMQFGFTHRAFQTQQEAVVEVGRVVYPVDVQDQRIGQGTDLLQPMPIRRVACQAGDFQIPALPTPTSATSRWKPSRSTAEAPDRPRSLSIVMMRSSVQPSAMARSRRAYCRFVLSLFSNLPERGLANVEISIASQVSRSNLLMGV
jgi:hypothetical protein